MDDNERKLIEQEILNVKAAEDNIIAEKQFKKTGIVTDSVPEAIKEKVKSKTINRVPPAVKKDDLKRCIVDLCEKLNIERPKSTFFRQTKAVLEDKVRELTAQLEKKLLSDKIDEKRREDMIAHPERNPAAVALYNANYIATEGLEGLSVLFKSKTFDIAMLEGLCKRITAKREQFLNVFARLAEEHGEVITKYFSPATEYAMLMASVAIPVVRENIEKKKPESDDKSTNSADNIDQL